VRAGPASEASAMGGAGRDQDAAETRDQALVIAGRPVTLESVPCCYCGSHRADLVFTGIDRLHGLPGRFAVVRCDRCHLMRTSPRPSRDSISLYYPPNYAPYAQTTVAPLSSSRLLGRRLFDPLDVATPSVRPGTLLELGSASGSFLAAMKGLGWEVTGVEPDSASAARAAAATGAPVLSSGVEDIEFAPRSYDLICAWMTFEHLHDPVAAFRSCHGWLRQGGWLAFSVPDCGSWQFSLFRGQWFALQLPTHLHHFTPETLSTILRACGYVNLQIFWQRTLSDVALSLAYITESVLPQIGDRARHVAGSLPSRILSRAAGVVAAPVRLTGRLTVWAQRP
jgi:SAM-dependent methyltransferase